MTHRKGKRAVERLLPFLCDAHAQSVVLAVLRNLYSIIRKDSNDKVCVIIVVLHVIITHCTGAASSGS